MKARFIAGLLGLVCAFSFAVAQDVTPTIGAGSKALLFTFSGLNTLGAGAYSGGIGGKYFLSNALAIRAGLQFNNYSSKISATAPNTVDGSVSATRFGITAAGEYHLTIARVSPYVGAGVSFSSGSTESKTAATSDATQIKVKNRTTGEAGYLPGSALGIFGLGGVEFFVTKEMSLGAEYQLGFYNNSLPDQEVTTGNVTVTTKGGSASTIGIFNGGGLTLSVYF